MKKFVTFAVAATLAVSIAACSNAPKTDDATTGGEETTETTENVVLGGWTINANAVSLLTPEEAEVFQQAMSEVVGSNYEPVAVIGQQVVAGMNYAYLCKATVVYPDAQPEWKVVIIYKDLEGNASFTGANDLDITDLQTIKAGGLPGATGAWEPPVPAVSAELPAKAGEAVDALNVEGAYELTPIALLGEQVVAGTNYQVLCVGRQPPAARGPRNDEPAHGGGDQA